MFEDELEELGRKGLLRKIKDKSLPRKIEGRKIVIGGRELLNFSSNDYLGLASHPKVIKAAKDALRAFGLGAGASRLLGGGCSLHGELEERLASFKGTEAALLFNSGYSANTAIIPALTVMTEGKGYAARGSVARGSVARGSVTLLSDELNHASIIDGCRLSRAETLVYRHRDTEHLESLLKGSGSRLKIVITDTVFSMEGDIAPLPEIYRMCKKHGAILYLDDAHGTGVLGGAATRGRGALAHFGLKPEPWIIQMGTLSKAVGSLGAFAAGSKVIIDWLINRARSFIYSTALPPPVVAASSAAIDVIEKDKTLIEKLWANRGRLMGGLKGADTGASETPIVPIMVKDVEACLGLSKHLMNKGVYAPAVRPPTVKTPRIRLTVTASHREEDIDGVLEALKRPGYEAQAQAPPAS